MRTSTERYRGLHIAASYLEKALDNIRPIVTTETENELRMEIKASLEKARALMTVAKDEES